MESQETLLPVSHGGVGVHFSTSVVLHALCVVQVSSRELFGVLYICPAICTVRRALVASSLYVKAIVEREFRRKRLCNFPHNVGIQAQRWPGFGMPDASPGPDDPCDSCKSVKKSLTSPRPVTRTVCGGGGANYWEIEGAQWRSRSLTMGFPFLPPFPSYRSIPFPTVSFPYLKEVRGISDGK
jgi:hypothetical protein